MAQHIGIVACSAEGAALCYRTHAAPGAAVSRGPFAAAWLHIAAAVGDAALARGFRRVGLTGTRWLVESRVYPDQLEARGIEYVRPTAAEREAINDIIFSELVRGIFEPDAVITFQRVIERMRGEGCDAVVLGCTEIPLLMNDRNSALPTLDSTRLLARAALRRAVG
jgi:aspartate racemase